MESGTTNILILSCILLLDVLYIYMLYIYNYVLYIYMHAIKRQVMHAFSLFIVHFLFPKGHWR